MSLWIYIDNSNVFIEGQRVSAVKTGMAANIYDAMYKKIIDPSYRIDFGALHCFLSEDNPSQICRAILFGSRPPPNDSLWRIAEFAGFDTVIEDRNAVNKEKRIDTGIVYVVTRDAYTKVNKTSDVIKLVAGDGDFVPAVEPLVNDGYQVHVVFWSHASQELIEAATTFTSLDSHIDSLRYNADRQYSA